MRRIACLAFGTFTLAAMPVTSAGALPLLNRVHAPEFAVTHVQYSHWKGRDFRRCMRAKYGPRYFSGVRRAQRFHMAQACGG